MTDTPTDALGGTVPTQSNTSPPVTPSRWHLIELVRSKPDARQGFAIFVGWWLAAVVVAMVAVGGGLPFTPIPLIVGGVDLLAALMMLWRWTRLNPGIIVATNTVLLSLLIVSGQVIAPLALASVAVMFAAAEAGQRWWYQALDPADTGLATRRASVRSPIEVLAIAGAAALIATVLGLVNSRVATVAALGLFAVIAIAVWILGGARRTPPPTNRPGLDAARAASRHSTPRR